LHLGLENSDTATTISLIVYIIIGIIAYFNGLAKNNAGLKSYGGFLIGLVIVRIFLVDVWTMELTWRIITFFVLGILLISTAFLGRKKELLN
jgi:uncharacterized membrane protein